MNKYKPVKYTVPKWEIIKKLAETLSKERGTDVSLADASTEAAKKMLEDKVNE